MDESVSLFGHSLYAIIVYGDYRLKTLTAIILGGNLASEGRLFYRTMILFVAVSEASAIANGLVNRPKYFKGLIPVGTIAVWKIDKAIGVRYRGYTRWSG